MNVVSALINKRLIKMAEVLRHQAIMLCLMLSLLLIGLLPVPALAYLDLKAAQVKTLENGLTVIVLEDHSFPVASVQMLYKSGARNEVTGSTGLAHFLEHMAFRSSENFPETEMVSRIYGAGGEWHGYTWLDQTTYYATAPKSQLELLLRIEADRMARLDIPEADLESERGAVLTEMHSYENDPTSVLINNVMYVSFLAHPYRNNTIGWESDIANIPHSELVDFYHQHYQPGNAVLAIVGDVNTVEVMQQVRENFAELQGQGASPLPHTIEPAQTGERRIRESGPVERKHFLIAYHAPSASSPDYAAFLLVQDMLAASSGVSFLQNDWGTAARPDSMLAGITDDLTTWFPPSAQDYVFTIGGSLPASGDETATEIAIQAGIERLRQLFSQDGSSTTSQTNKSALQDAKARVERELIFDLQTTEDAAHQLAFFAGLDALGVLVSLPDLLNQVEVADVRRVLDRYLRKEQRTIGWYVPDTSGSVALPAAKPVEVANNAQWTGSNVPNKTSQETASPANLQALSNGTPVIIQRSPLSPTAMLKVVVPSADFALSPDVSQSQPAWGLTALDFELLPGEVQKTIAEAADIIDSASPMVVGSGGKGTDPGAVLEGTFQNMLGLQYPQSVPAGPILLVVTGDIDPARVLAQLEARFGHQAATQWQIPQTIEPLPPAEIEKHVALPVAQEQLGYLVQVPGPREQNQAAWQMALYILTHGYEGRLGKAAISNRGLVYYISSAWHTDGQNDWITINTGVDPKKLSAMKDLLREQLDLLITQPPSLAEIEAARSHLLGRYLSASQSNRELADSLTRQWVWHGDLIGYAELKRKLDEVDQQDIMDILPAFTRGTVVSITNPVQPKQ